MSTVLCKSNEQCFCVAISTFKFQRVFLYTEITTEITEIISDVISLGEFGDFGDFGGNFDDIGGVVGDFGDCGSDFGKKIHPRDITAIFAASVSMMFVR